MLDEEGECVAVRHRQSVDRVEQIDGGLLVLLVLNGVREVLPQSGRNDRLAQAAQEVLDAAADDVDVEVRQRRNGFSAEESLFQAFDLLF